MIILGSAPPSGWRYRDRMAPMNSGGSSSSLPTLGHKIVLAAMFFVSGALTYQVLWVRELGLLFGSTAEAAALTIAIFFAGIAIGGWFWGCRAGRMRRPLRAFGWLEIGVAGAALAHFFVADLYFALYPTFKACWATSLSSRTC